MPSTSVSDLAAKSASLKAEYAALDPAEVRKGVIELVTSDVVLDTMEMVIPLWEVMSDDDALKQHIGNWLQVVKGVSLLAKQEAAK